VTTTTKDPIDVAVETLAYIKENPQEWNQNDWNHCFAGHFARLDPETVTEMRHNGSTCDCCSATTLSIEDAAGVAFRSNEWFRRRLGPDAYALTDHLNTLAQLEAGVAALREGGDVVAAIRAVGR
jgi:hypothetical protein